ASMTRRGAVVSSLVLLAVAVTAPAVSAARWVVRSSPRPVGATRAGLQAVSCATRQFCMAVGTWTNEPYGGQATAPLAERFNGRRWTLSLVGPMTTGPAGLAAVSCTSRHFCVAVGQRGDGGALVDRFDGA